MAKNVDWAAALQPLIKQYKGRKHPLNYENGYQLLVAIVLSAQDSDKHINKVTPAFFEQYPNVESLINATPETLEGVLHGVRNFWNKSTWLIKIAKEIKTNANIPTSMEELVALPGIGRKSANVYKREMGAKAEGVMVDLHVVRVTERLGITQSTEPKKIEQDIMKVVPEKDWSEVGMAISFLGRDICRPTNPKHGECVMRDVCRYYEEVGKKNIPTKPLKTKVPKKSTNSKQLKPGTLHNDPDLYARTKDGMNKKATAKKKVAKKSTAKKKASK